MVAMETETKSRPFALSQIRGGWSPGQMESQVSASWKLALTCDSVWPWLACTWDDLRSLWLSSHLHASESKFFTVWPPNASRRKLVSVLFSFVWAHVQRCTEMTFLLLALSLRLLASPFGRTSQVCVCKFTFPNLRWLVTPLGQGFREGEMNWECEGRVEKTQR